MYIIVDKSSKIEFASRFINDLKSDFKNLKIDYIFIQESELSTSNFLVYNKKIETKKTYYIREHNQVLFSKIFNNE